MDRTGIEQSHSGEVVELSRAIGNLGLGRFRGLHVLRRSLWRIGNARKERAAAHSGYDRLLKVVSGLEQKGMRVPEVITAGTPTFPCSVAYEGFCTGRFIHRVSPGTTVYAMPPLWRSFRASTATGRRVLVLTRVVSQSARWA